MFFLVTRSVARSHAIAEQQCEQTQCKSADHFLLHLSEEALRAAEEQNQPGAVAFGLELQQENYWSSSKYNFRTCFAQEGQKAGQKAAAPAPFGTLEVLVNTARSRTPKRPHDNAFAKREELRIELVASSGGLPLRCKSPLTGRSDLRLSFSVGVSTPTDGAVRTSLRPTEAGWRKGLPLSDGFTRQGHHPRGVSELTVYPKPRHHACLCGSGGPAIISKLATFQTAKQIIIVNRIITTH